MQLRFAREPKLFEDLVWPGVRTERPSDRLTTQLRGALRQAAARLISFSHSFSTTS